MSRRAAKPRAASGKAFAAAGSSAFGAFSSTSSGSTLSYLTEPPDFSAISDAHIIVSFKNLLKKDSTTKAKALEDLVTYAEAHPYEKDGGSEEPILEAWVGYICGGSTSYVGYLVMYITGPTVSSHLNRQFSPRTRALSHSAT